MKCKKCGTVLRADDEFCYRCGRRTTVWQRLFSSSAVVGSAIAIVIVVAAAIVTWMFVTGRWEFPSFPQKNGGDSNSVVSDSGEDGDAEESAATPEPTAEPTPKPTPKIVYPVDVTKSMKSELKALTARLRPFLAFSASYYENGRHAFKWDDVSATMMAVYNLQFLDKSIRYGTPFADITKKAKKEIKNIFSKNAKFNFTYGGSYPDYVFVRTGDTIVYNVVRIDGKTYSMKTEKITEYKKDKFKVTVNAGLVSAENKQERGYFQKYSVYVDKDEEAMYGYVVKKIKLVKAS